MTVEVDVASFPRAAHSHHTSFSPTSPMSNAAAGSFGTPSIVSPNGILSPTASMMSTPIGNDSIINRRADPAQGLYQTCSTLRGRLRDVPDFEKFLDPPETMDPDVGPEDPVTQLWRCFRMGSSLCVLYNATRPAEPIPEQRLNPGLRTLNDCKAATFHFLKGIKTHLGIDGDEAFMIHNLYSDDTNGFVKVTRTVARILDYLTEHDLLLTRAGPSTNGAGQEKKPMDSRMRVVQELVDTERKYVQDLENLQEYKVCLEQREIISKDLIHNIFLNLNGLVDFQRRFLIRVETQNDLAPEEQNWGRLFVQYEKSFSVYEPYASNFSAANDLAAEEREKLAVMPHPVYDQLQALLIKPVQRITKYPLLLRDLIKYTDPQDAEDQGLSHGLEAIERIATQINEAIRQSENKVKVKELHGRVEDWKGHRLDHFGELLLDGQFSVIKGDQKGEVEREYHIYLFQRILLCCKEIGSKSKSNKTMSMGKNAKQPLPTKKKPIMQLKGRIFMQNVTDVIALSRNGSYTLQIFWKGDPGVENFMIKHTNEEGLNLWKKTLQAQRETQKKADGPTATRGSAGSGGMQFAWMQTVDATTDQGRSSNELSDEEEEADGTYFQTSTPSTSTYASSSRNGSSSSLRSRSATNEMPAPPTNFRGPRYPHPTGHQPPLTLNTNPAIAALQNSSPDRNNQSYFSPVTETPGPNSGRNNPNGNSYPFPRQPTPNYYGDDPNRYTPPSMSRTPSREGAPIPPQSAQFAPPQYQNGSRLQRPSLPGIGPNGQPGPQSSQRLRSASSPNIHHIPNGSQSSRTPNVAVPPVPPVPYQAYSGGPAVINRSQNSSPTSPNLPLQGRPSHPSIQPTPPPDTPSLPTSGVSTPITPAMPKSPSQVKVKIHFNNDKLAIIVPYGIAYSQLLDRVERKVKICAADAHASIRIRYQDEDGDFISMNSDEDVQMAFDASLDASVDGTVGSLTLFVQLG